MYVTLPGKLRFTLCNQKLKKKKKKKNAIGKRMMPVPREDKVEMILSTGFPQSW